MAQSYSAARESDDSRKVLIDISNGKSRQVKCLMLHGAIATVADAVSKVEAGLRRTAIADVPALTELEIFEPDFCEWYVPCSIPSPFCSQRPAATPLPPSSPRHWNAF